MPKKSQTLTLPLLITRSLVVYPECSTTIEAGRDFSINAVILSRDNSDSLLFITSQKNFETENPKENDIYNIGCLCRITTCTSKEKGIRAKIEIVERVKLDHISFDATNKYYIAQGTVIKFPPIVEDKNRAIITAIDHLLTSNPEIVGTMPRNLANFVAKTNDAVSLCFAIANFIPASIERKQKILEAKDVDELLQLVTLLLNGESQRNQIQQEISKQVRESTEKSQKEYFLREQLKAIKKELGEGDGSDSDPDSILEKLEKNPYPENIKAKVKNELKRFEMMPFGSQEGALIQSYLDVLMNVPWWQKTEDNDDLKNVEKILDEDHYGLEEPKKRIIEYLAVKKLTGNLKSPILCFFGPPGTGKTSLGKSIARALGRKFFKASLGGISDESEIRGHRRTYVGSMPGRIINGMKKTGVVNPVFLLDEIDKLASSYKGDPASALLEVLDPEQNTQFNDNYLEEPYDLSDVLFICTANYLDNIPAPLRDRLELIQLSSYTEIEKVHIAKEHLIAKQTAINGLTPEKVSFTDEAITFIIRAYTRESGVRELERKIATCLRKVAVSVVKDPKKGPTVIDVEKVKKFLSTPIFEEDKKEKEPQIGVVTGLAYTDYGGTTLPIEVNNFPGKGRLILTGQLGDVMKESASIALSYVKSNAKKFKIKNEIFEQNDIHIHYPEGAVPKDGPSAGVATTIALISCLSKQPVDSNVAMTGEVTLRGKALAIGGLREKSLAALRSGIKTIIVPKENKKDIDELPKEVKNNLTIKYMSCVDDAVKIAIIPQETKTKSK